MAKRVAVLIHDDWEIRGNGTGNVADLQYVPSLFLLRLCDELGMRITFMAEVMQQISMLRFAERDRNLRMQAHLWEQCLHLYYERGHDVQLHIHPHWHEATFDNGFFRLGKNWNLATFPREERRFILRAAVSYLNDVMSRVDADYRLAAFKAGSWGLQPSGDFMRDLEEFGIKLLMGPGRAVKIKSEHFSADYTSIEEDLLPYYPEYDDVQRVSKVPTRIVVVPLPYYRFTFGEIVRKTSERLKSRRFNTPPMVYHSAIPAYVASNAPLKSVRVGGTGVFGRFGLRNFSTSGGTFEDMRFGLDQVMQRCLDADADVVPLVVEGHTKDLPGRYEDVARFYRYMIDRYGAVIEFKTLTEFIGSLPLMNVVVAAH